MTADSVVIELGILAPFEVRNVQVVVQVDASVPIGTWLSSIARIMPLDGDVAPACNTAISNLQTVGSFDPNDIVVDRPTIELPELSGTPWLDYTIRFQNTGTDTAFYVRVENPISADLREGTLEIIGTSHPCSISYQNYGAAMHFVFDDILLPHSTTDEAASHGTIRYRILPKATLLLGDIIENDASIFFDYNPPVATNTVGTEIISSTSVPEPVNSLFIYPDPATDRLNISIRPHGNGALPFRLYNNLGQIQPVSVTGSMRDGRWTGTVDISGLSSGVYLLLGPGQARAVRFIKE